MFMKNKVLNTIDECSQRLESYVKQREELVRKLKNADIAIAAERRAIMVLKELMEDLDEGNDQQ